MVTVLSDNSSTGTGRLDPKFNSNATYPLPLRERLHYKNNAKLKSERQDRQRHQSRLPPGDFAEDGLTLLCPPAGLLLLLKVLADIGLPCLCE